MLDAIVDFLKALGISAPGELGWVTVTLTFVIAALAAWWFMPRVRLYSLRVGWADEPNPRRVNKEPLPNAGGLALFASVIVGLVIATLVHRIALLGVQVQVLAILLGGSFMILAGFVDDQYGLPPVFRLAVQVLASLLLVSTGIRINVAFGGELALAISVILTVVWIVAITNAINLIDGVDGLAGGVSFITAMSLLAVSAQDSSRAAAAILLAALGGAALGFLRHNFPPSRIIMGDSGAYFFGFVLAASSILGSLKVTTVFALFPAVFVLVLVFLLPLLDTFQVIVRRLVRRKNPLSTPGTDHLHHRLLARGLSHTRTTLILWGVTLVTNVAAMIVQKTRWTVIVTTAVGIVILLGFVAWRRRRAHRRAKAREAAAAAAAPAAAAGAPVGPAPSSPGSAPEGTSGPDS